MTTKASLIDLNGNEMILDADADTSITADTDDQIDFKVGGTDRLSLKSDGKLSVTEINHITSGTLEIGNGDEKQLFDASGSTIQFQTNDTEAMRIDAAGIVTKPLQPAFDAYNSSDQTISGWTQLTFDTEEYDQNGDFASSIFTAPVAGVYIFNGTVRYASAIDYAYMAFFVNNVQPNASNQGYFGLGLHAINSSTFDGDNTFVTTQMIKLAATDTVRLYAYHSASITISGARSRTHFAGYLLG